MVDGEQIQVTEQDVQALVRKVQDFAETLSVPEQAVLATWLGVSSEADDTAGYFWMSVGTGWTAPAPTQPARFNQAETLASSVQKKLNDTNQAVIGKV
jgi:hypothetical protein